MVSHPRSFIDAKCRWRCDRLDGAGSNREPFGQSKGIKIHQGAKTHGICCIAAQWVEKSDTSVDPN